MSQSTEPEGYISAHGNVYTDKGVLVASSVSHLDQMYEYSEPSDEPIVTASEFATWCREGTKRSALGTQEGGSHYQQGGIQPVEFIVSNDIPYREANVIKYVFRHARKNGAEDLRKARHYIDMLLEDYDND